MKKYILLILCLSVAVPMGLKFSIESCASLLAGCSGGACLIEDATSSPVNNKYMPSKLNDLHRIDAFQPKAESHSPQPIVNMDSPNVMDSSNKLGQDCQFGVCFPGSEQRQNSQTNP